MPIAMSDEKVMKKRGRPRKVDPTNRSIDAATSTSASTGILKSRTLSSTSSDQTQNDGNATKSSRKQQQKLSQHEIEEIVEARSETPKRAGKRKASIPAQMKSSILGQATAFDAAVPLKAKLEPANTFDLSLSNDTSSSKPSTPSELKSASEYSSQSAFLSSFLNSSYKEPPPAPPETSFVSDRAAFSSSSATPSIEDIIRGDGVTSLSSLSKTEQSTTRDRFKPATINPAQAAWPTKSFQGYGLHAFPDQRQVRNTKPVRLNIPPELYASKSFHQLKSSDTPQSTIPKSTTSNSTAATTPTAQREFSTASSSPSQTTNKPNLHNPLPRPIPAPAINPTNPNISRPRPQAQPELPGIDRPKRPTEMTSQELLANRKFRTARRRYTGLIVGIPVLLVTSLEVYRRFGNVIFAEDEGTGIIRVEGMERRRGELPPGIVERRTD